MSVITDKAYEHIVPIVESLGYEVVDVEYKALYGRNTLTFYIYKLGGITIEDCVRVNDALDGPLEIFDITDGAAYDLNVSSPGLDRPIVSDRDFERNYGEDVELVFAPTLSKKKHTHGILKSHNETTVTIDEKNVEKQYERKNIKIVRPYIKF